jgi:hypothetical protein
VSGAPICLEWCTLVSWYLAPANGNGPCPHEGLFGDTCDISFLCFYFWEEILYYDKSKPCPENNLLPGQILGMAENQGDAFTYKILTCPPKGSNEKPRVLIKSVIFSKDPMVAPANEAVSLPSMCPTLNNLDFESHSKRYHAENDSRSMRDEDSDPSEPGNLAVGTSGKRRCTASLE